MNEQIRSVNEFYNLVAPYYNRHMTDADKKARDCVHTLIKQHVLHQNVMDFGGGTGLDIPWFTEHNYHVYFVEPSTNMRSIARASNASNRQITFIDTGTDFDNWNENDLPFQQKVNGIMANFAVLNCIEDIDLLFAKLALVASDDCHIIATVIDPRFAGMVRNYSILSAIRMILQPRLTILNKYDGQLHPTYVHSLRSLERASRNHFALQSIHPLQSSSFVALIFKRR
jgi:hypothetical protein